MYANFWDVTASALEFAAHSMNLELSPRQRADLMNGYLALRAWPDVKDALSTLQRSGIQVALLSNATDQILLPVSTIPICQVRSNMLSALTGSGPSSPIPGLSARYAAHGSCVNEILFVAFAGWDVAGAGWFGYPTFWNNRQNATAEELNVRADATGATLADLLNFLRSL